MSTQTVTDAKTFRFLFRRPVSKDWAFRLWVGISIIAILAYFAGDSSQGKLGATNYSGVISGLTDAAFGIFNFLIFYVISLIWLIPRRMFSLLTK